jgi:hypothetical protein
MLPAFLLSSMFSTCSAWPATVGHVRNPPLRPATADEIAEALSFALSYQGRKRVHHADDAMGGSPRSGWCSTWKRRGSC